jgi:endoglucanase
MEWNMNSLFKFTVIAIAAAFCSSAMAEDITPTRVGPVSQYGKLIAGKNSQNKGQIYGSCEGVKDGAEVQVRGMSLYWSLMDEALDFWSEDGITTMVKDMKIQIVRAAMAAGNEDWTKGKYIGYAVQPDSQTQFVKRVVEAAIKQDIYVIIDWHSHTANTQTENAVKFFGEMAQAYGKYDNVIFEVFNEPQKIEWSVIKTYADAVVAEIRKYSDNLILVGTPEWDQYPNRVIGSEINDPKQNTAYTFHYYAGTHCFSGKHEGMFGQSWPCEGENAVEAMNAGLSVFVSEWGVTTSDGKGSVAGDNDGWQNWMNEHKLSWANWSASRINEGSAAFDSATATPTSLTFTKSGDTLKSYLSTNADSYTLCPTKAPASSDTPAEEQKPASSSSVPTSSTPAPTSSSPAPKSSASDAIHPVAAAPAALTIHDRTVSFIIIKNGTVRVRVFDALGHARMAQTLQLSGGTHNVELKGLPAGKYVVQVSQGQSLSQASITLK